MGFMDKNYRQIEQFIDGPTTISSKAYQTDNDTSDKQVSQTPQEPPLTMEAFLADIEKRAYHMAAFATNSHAEALDLLQDTMIKLVTNYAEQPSNQWKPLFYKILQNRIRDWHRHQKVKNLIFFWQSPEQSDEDDAPAFESQMGDEKGHTPESDIEKAQQQQAALQHLKQLSEKQQQCFLLRSWEGLSTEQTAEIMDCSQGSVKTHYSRAVHKLKTLMEADHDITF